VRPALRRLANFAHEEAVRFAIELVPVAGQLPIRGELKIVAEIEPEFVFR
jgi:hypothetical protein